MTMETYHWEKKHQSDPPMSVSIMRTLPEGDWTVRSEETTLPPEFPTRYDTLKAAMAAADEMAVQHFRHHCGPRGCGEWMPVPPAHQVASGSRADQTGQARRNSVIAAPTRKATWTRAAVLGTAAGLCAVFLSDRLGLSVPQHSHRRATQFMTVGWYLAGALAAAFIATRVREAS